MPTLQRTCVFICLLLGLLKMHVSAQAEKPLICGIALGYPPYQFTTEGGEPTGIDAEITRLVFEELGEPFLFSQKNWDDVYLSLAHNMGDVDLLCGAEVNDERKIRFDFSEPYYRRIVVIFVRNDSEYRSFDDLHGMIVTGDRGGFIEKLINRQNVRIMNTASKEVSFMKLKRGEVQAVIAPLEVGTWLCRQMNLPVRTLSLHDPGSPVAFAVAKGNAALAKRISEALDTLRENGRIDEVIKKYQ